jgi:hypothetical protein
MRHALTFMGFLIAVAIGLSIASLGTDTAHFASEVAAQTNDLPRFRLLYGSFRGDYLTYTFQTPPEEKNYAEDCLGCEEEVGNAVIFAEFGCRDKSQYLFDSNSEREVVEKEPILDSDGMVVGERRLTVFREKDGTVIAGRMFWIEGDDFWAVQAPTVELTKALRESEQYKEVRKEVAEEIKTYVPIQNANTTGKDRCEGGFTQRRVTH